MTSPLRAHSALETCQRIDAGKAELAGSARIHVAPGADVESELADRQAGTAVCVDFSGCTVGERDACATQADIELEVLGDVVARLEIDVDRRLVVGLGDTAENVVVGDAATEGDIPGIECRRRRSLDGLHGHIRSKS